MDDIPNKLVTKKFQPDESFQYGYAYSKSPRTIIETLFDIFDEMGIEYIIKSNQKLIKVAITAFFVAIT